MRKVHDLVFGPFGSNAMKPESATTTAVDSRLAAARLLAVAATGRLPTAPEAPDLPPCLGPPAPQTSPSNMVEDIKVRQGAQPSGAFLSEAIRCHCYIVV